MRGRRLGGVVLGALAAMLVAWSPIAVSPVLAADPLRVAADTTYTVDVGAGRVHVAIRYTFTNNKPNTSTIIYYYREVSVGVQPGARDIRAADGSGELATSSTRHTNFTRADVRLRANLYYHRSATFTLRYDLVAGAPRSTSPIRVGRAFVTFPVWAFGDQNLGDLEVRMPARFTSTIDGDQMTVRNSTSGNVLTASPATPDEFFAIITGENNAAYERDLLSLPGGVEVAVLSWPEDPRWSDTVKDTLRDGMPELQAEIGLDWPVEDRLDVRERYSPSLEGYAGLFFTDEQRIDVSEDLDPITIVHEASHAWFNEGLFGARWIYEGLAEEYAWRVLTAVGGDPQELPDRPDPTAKDHVALNAWVFPTAVRDDTQDTELYGYEVSFWLLHLIVDTAGEEQMRLAFEHADANLTAYPGDGAPEPVGQADDWRRFLDLTEPLDEPDPVEVTDAVARYVLDGSGASLLGERHDARETYRGLLADPDGWVPPWYVRVSMGTWAFREATARMAEARAVLTLRDEVEGAAVAEGLPLGVDLEAAYEQATNGFDDATALGQHELAAIHAIADAHAKVGAEPDVFAQIGLLGDEAPSVTYEAARTAFGAGDLDGAIAQAGTTASIVASASARGQERVIMGAIVLVALVALLVFIVVVRRRRGRGPIGVEPGTAAFLALDGRFTPDAAATPGAVATPGAAAPPGAAARPGAPVASEPVGPSGTLAADPDWPSSPPGGSPSDLEGGPTDT